MRENKENSLNQEPKKKWSRPKLIILTQGKHEERVLTACKSGYLPAGPLLSAMRCINGVSVGHFTCQIPCAGVIVS